MKFFNEGTLKPIQSWCDNPEEGCLQQARNLANLPFVFRKVCLMPDTHQGYGMPVGGVMATRDVVVPNAVGVDIGCGMAAVMTNLFNPGPEALKRIIQHIRETVPVGFNHHDRPQDMGDLQVTDGLRIVTDQYQRATHSLGTLGGGNHFIELQEDGSGRIWAMLHSGSRNLGKQVADFYNKAAVEINEAYHSSVPKEWELAFLPFGSPQADQYLEEMRYCMRFAKANRKAMLNRVMEALYAETGCQFEQPLDIHHNYAAMENHFGQNVMVHRKGATSARAGELGIIPGSQGTASYIVEGLGNPESFNSCSHGAGRKMGRKEAIRKLDLQAEMKALDDQGIIHAVRQASDLDEAPGSYKDILTVMSEQMDLVKINTKLRPLAVIKG